MVFTVLIIATILLETMEICFAFPTDFPRPYSTFKSPDSDSVIVQVPVGDTVTLKCSSNDKDHSFIYWHFNDRNILVGPTSRYYDFIKYNYEVLSGNLTIRAVSSEEEGLYNCVSRGVKRKDDFNIRSVRMIVEKPWEDVYEKDPDVNLFRITIVLGTLVVISVLGYFAYRIWKTRYRNPSYLVNEDEDDDSVEEIFNAPTSSNIVKNYTRDTPGMSTDFNSILDAANSE